MGGRARGAFSRFGRSGGTGDERQVGDHGDGLDDEYGDYEEQVDMLLNAIMEKEEKVKKKKIRKYRINQQIVISEEYASTSKDRKGRKHFIFNNEMVQGIFYPLFLDWTEPDI